MAWSDVRGLAFGISNLSPMVVGRLRRFGRLAVATNARRFSRRRHLNRHFIRPSPLLNRFVHSTVPGSWLKQEITRDSKKA